MAAPEFIYQDPLPIEKDTTRYRLLTKDYVLVTNFEGEEIIKVDPAGADITGQCCDSRCFLFTAHGASGRAGHGSDLENRSGRLSGVYPGGRQRKRFLQADSAVNKFPAKTPRREEKKINFGLGVFAPLRETYDSKLDKQQPRPNSLEKIF